MQLAKKNVISDQFIVYRYYKTLKNRYSNWVSKIDQSVYNCGESRFPRDHRKCKHIWPVYRKIIFQVLFIFFWALNINAKRLLFLLFLSQIINWINTNDMQEHDQQNSKEHLQSYPSLSLTTSFLIILIMKHGQVTWTKNLKNWTYISTSCLYKRVFNCLKWQPNLRFHNFFSCGG